MVVMEKTEWDSLFQELQNSAAEEDELPSLNILTDHGASPFQILVSTVLSLRTRDDVTLRASRKLFNQATTPRQILDLDLTTLEELIFPAGFYKTKAKQLQEISRILLQDYQGEVPREKDRLLNLPGVGPKTANLVLNLAFQTDAICVDTHVHRISNRLALVTTKTAEETEKALEKVLPKEYWISINTLMVSFGQTVCTPASPHCLSCPLQNRCPQRGVLHKRP